MNFFKVLLPGFESKLLFPQAYCANRNGYFPRKAMLTTELGTWKIDVGKCREIFYFRGQIWESFIRAHELSVGDFIVFEHEGNMNFNALVFGPSACNKEFPGKMNIKFEEHGVSSSRPCRIPPFRKIICPGTTSTNLSRLSRMYIPVEIFRPNDLHEKKGAILRIKGSSGKEWPVMLTHYKDGHSHGVNYERLALTKGWLEFCSSNNIKEGDDCTFETIDTNSGDFGDVIIINVTVSPKRK